jgi:hypothetical protein
MSNNSQNGGVETGYRRLPFGYFSIKRPNTIATAGPHQINYLTHAVQNLSSHNATTIPQDVASLVVSDDEVGNFVNPAVTATPRSSNANTRKRALSDEAQKLTTSTASKNIKGSASTYTNVTCSKKQRNGSESLSESFLDTLLDAPEAVKHRHGDAESSVISSTAKGKTGKPISRTKGANVTEPATRQHQTRTIGKSVKIKRSQLLSMQVKPTVRLLARPRFVRRVSLDHGPEDHVLGAVKEETRYFSAILEPSLPGFIKTEKFSVKFIPPRDIDARIAQGLKTSAVDCDPEGRSYATEDAAVGDGDDEGTRASKATEAKMTAKYLNTPIVHHGLDLTLPPIHNLQEIFEDMVLNGLHDSKSHQLPAFLEHIQGRQLRVGTMCSGTECPVLALELINDGQSSLRAAAPDIDSLTSAALTRIGRRNISFVHVLSCEIVPYKQAYIQRNFNPGYLFRDVTELPGEKA